MFSETPGKCSKKDKGSKLSKLWNVSEQFEIKIGYWVVVSNIFYFHPYLGKIPILTNIFLMG